MTERMTDEEIEAKVARDEKRIRDDERARIIQGDFTDVTDEAEPEQTNAGRDTAAG